MSFNTRRGETTLFPLKFSETNSESILLGIFRTVLLAALQREAAEQLNVQFSFYVLTNRT